MDKIIETEFEAKQKMPKKMRNEAIREILNNLLMVVIVLVLLSIISFMDESIIKGTYATGLKAISTFLVVMGVIFFEIAYRKEKYNTFFWAVEFAVLGMIIMFVPYLSKYVQRFIIGITVGFGIYYLVKFLFIFLKKKKEFSDTKSDIKQIIKDEKSGYLDDVSKKKYGKKENKK